MLGDLKTVEDKLYQPEALDTFLQKHSVHDLIKLLNKATKKETKDRIRYCFSKVASSHRYKDLFCACLTEEEDKRKQFVKFVASDNSEEFYALLQSKPDDVLHVIENNQQIIPILIQLIGYEHGIKLVKLFSKLYQQADKYDCLFNPLIKQALALGLGFEEGTQQPREDVDTVAQMRYLEIVVNVCILGGKCYQFLGDLLGMALSLYKTQDILLKMAMVQVIANLGEGAQTSKLLKEHSIWKLVQKDACDPDQEFYVKKFLLVLLIDMAANGHYEISQKVVKHIHVFLSAGLKAKGEELQSAIDLIGHLFRSVGGVRIVVQNTDVLSSYVTLSRSTKDALKSPYYSSLISLTENGCTTSKEAKEHPKYKLVINILNCIGNPNLTGELTQNLHANNYMVYGLEDFSKWFAGLLQLPFEEAELQLIQIFSNLLNFYEVAEALLQVQETTKYLLKQYVPSDSNKVLRNRKGELIRTIIAKGKSDWDGLQLSEYSRNLAKMLQNSKYESMYALDVE